MYEEEQLKKRLYRSLIATFLIIGLTFIGFRFFASGIGSFFSAISRIGKTEPKEDSLAPNQPFFSDAPRVTNKRTISLKGFSEPGSTVKIYVNGPETGSVTADESGMFSTGDITLIDGRNMLFAKAVDSYDNVSEPSKTIEIVFDDKKPKITISEPKDGSTVKNLNMRVPVKGSTDEKCEVRVNDRFAITNPDNTFELLLGVSGGELIIKIEATDEAGNKSDETIKVRYVNSGV